MKKFFAVVLALAMALSLVACATSNQAPEGDDGAAEEQVYSVEPRKITDRTLNVAIVPITMNTSYTMTIKGALQEVEDKGWDINVIVQAPSSNSSSITEQGDIVENLIQQGVDAIVLSTESDAAMLPYLCDLLQRILPLRPLRDCGFTEADFKAFPLSVEANQQRLMTNAYYPFDLDSEETIYRECF